MGQFSFALGKLTRVRDRLERLKNLDFSPLMLEWEAIMEEDNRTGILAGLDKDGRPMLPVTYRPTKKPLLPNKRQTNNGNTSVMGFGPSSAGLNNNLTYREYRRLAGPPLAPRGASSRVVTNHVTRSGRRSGRWFAEAGWADIVDTRGKPFLKYLLEDRDIAGVRPTGRQLAWDALHTFIWQVWD